MSPLLLTTTTTTDRLAVGTTTDVVDKDAVAVSHPASRNSGCRPFFQPSVPVDPTGLSIEMIWAREAVEIVTMASAVLNIITPKSWSSAVPHAFPSRTSHLISSRIFWQDWLSSDLRIKAVSPAPPLARMHSNTSVTHDFLQSYNFM